MRSHARSPSAAWVAAREQRGWEIFSGYDQLIAAVRERLGEDGFRAPWAEGRKMTLDQALEYAEAGAALALPD